MEYAVGSGSLGLISLSACRSSARERRSGIKKLICLARSQPACNAATLRAGPVNPVNPVQIACLRFALLSSGVVFRQ